MSTQNLNGVVAVAGMEPSLEQFSLPETRARKDGNGLTTRRRLIVHIDRLEFLEAWQLHRRCEA